MKLERREIIKTSPLIVSADCLKLFPGRGAGRRIETEPSSPTELRSRDWLEFVGQVVRGERWNREIENVLDICRAVHLDLWLTIDLCRYRSKILQGQERKLWVDSFPAVGNSLHCCQPEWEDLTVFAACLLDFTLDVVETNC